MNGAAAACRETCAPRRDWERRCEACGFAFHSAPGVTWKGAFGALDEVEPYWNEGAMYVLEAPGADALEAAAQELHNLCLEACRDGVAHTDRIIHSPLRRNCHRHGAARPLPSRPSPRSSRGRARTR